MCHITYGAIIQLSIYCKVHSQIQLVSCCEGFPSHLKERFLHFNNRIISLFGTDRMDQFVYFSYIILLVYIIVSYTATHLSFLSILCKYIKPAIPVDYCRKSGEVQRKERFLHLITEKNVYFALCHTLHHYKTLRIIFALRCVHSVYIIIIFPYCISSATIFPISTLFSPSFFGFSSAIFFSISIYCGFTSFYHYAALVVPFCTWLCFFLFSFALLM